MKKAKIWVPVTVLTPILIILLIPVLLYIPAVQNWAVHTVAEYASEETGMNISVDRVRLVFPLDLGVEGVLVTQQNDSLPQVTDTIARIDRVVADVQFMPLLSSNVEIDRFDMYGMQVNTADFIHQARVKGKLGTLSIASHGIKLKDETVRLDNAYIADAKLDIALSDTVPEDTTKTDVFWKIDLDKLQAKNADITVHMPGDTLKVNARIGNLDADNGHFDLYKGLYQLASISLKEGSIAYDNNFMPHSTLLSTAQGGFDMNHIVLSDMNVGIDSLYFCGNDIKLKIREGSMVEKCGIGINRLTADIAVDSTQVRLITDLATRNCGTNPSSSLKGNVIMDLNVLDSINPGKVFADLEASLSKTDLMLAMGDMPKAFQQQWPASSLEIKAKAKGNMQRVDIETLSANLPGALSIVGNGYAVNPTSINNLKAKLHVDAKTGNLNFIKTLLDKDMQKMIALPALHATADIDADGPAYKLNFNVAEGKGKISGKANVNTKLMAYDANLDAHGVQLNHFVKGMQLGAFSGNVDLSGKGTDFMSAATNVKAKARVKSFEYNDWNLSDLNLDAQLADGHGNVTVNSNNALLDGTVAIDALMSRNPIQATLTTELNNADIFKFGFSEMPLAVSGCAHIDIASDLDNFYLAQGLVSDLTITDSAHVYRPDDLVLDVLTRVDTTHAVVDCGDFHLNADMQGGYKSLMSLSDKLFNEISRQWSNRVIEEQSLRQILPFGKFYLSSGKENPIYRSAKLMGCEYSNIYIDITSSPVAGINGDLRIDTLKTEGLQLDHITAKLSSDEETMHYDAVIENGKDNPQYAFKANAKGKIVANGVTLAIALDDKDKKQLAQLGMSAAMETGGIRMKFDNSKQILGYMNFSVNNDNYVFFSDDMRLSANVIMNGSDGTGIQIYTDDENLDALQDITVSLHKFDIKKILSQMPYMPNASGIMNGDFHAIFTPEDFSVSSNIEFQNLIYENNVIGNMSSEFVYMPKEGGTHYIDGLIFKDDNEVGTISGTYNPEGIGSIDAEITMNEFPLDIVNGFVPNQIVGIDGKGNGNLTIKGLVTEPDVNGEIFMKGASVKSVPYGVTMTFADTPIKFDNSSIQFNDFKLYANNDQPLIVNGYVDFSNLDHIFTSLRMTAKNFLLVDAKETRRSEAYGKAFVNVNTRMSGELQHLTVWGQIDVLSTTDLYYILRDSPITTDNRLKELVTFSDLKNEKHVTIQRPDVDGMKIQMNINVADGSHVKCWLNTNHTNYVDIFAGGELRALYNGGNISVTGKCTISEGEMKYSLPVIPLKTFTIANGSYIEFTGDPMNPRLNITATEQNKTNVNINGVNQTVMFDCGVIISKTLNNMGLEFTIDAPENQAISDELKTKSIEERGKLAVTMLTTGMYLTEENTSSFTMNSALSSFLQSEINQIAGSALRTLDLSVGLENSIDETGQTHMDYSFKFAKRFWNNRLSISVGGKISTGPEVSGQNSSFFDNVEMQYRLSDTSNQYLQLFYKRAVYDYLEGYLGQYGAGYMYKRKVQHFRDIFGSLVPHSDTPNDSIK